MKWLCEEAEMNLSMFSGTVLDLRGTRDIVLHYKSGESLFPMLRSAEVPTTFRAVIRQ